MKPTLSKVKNFRGRIIGHKASIGPISAGAKTPAEASASCEQATLAALSRLDRGTYVGQWRGRTYVCAPTTDGWRYWLDVFSRHDYFVDLGCDTLEDVQDSALHHLAQNVWEPSVTDDAAFVDGLPREVAEKIAQWIRFQRAYARIKAEGGKTDTEIHRLACEASYG